MRNNNARNIIHPNIFYFVQYPDMKGDNHPKYGLWTLSRILDNHLSSTPFLLPPFLLLSLSFCWPQPCPLPTCTEIASDLPQGAKGSIATQLSPLLSCPALPYIHISSGDVHTWHWTSSTCQERDQEAGQRHSVYARTTF